MFHHNFYPKPTVDLEDADLTQEIRQKLLDLQQKYYDIISKHSSTIGLTHLENMKINIDPNVPSVANTLTSKHHKFVKEEIENLLEAGLIERSMSPYAAPIIVVPRKSKPGAPLAETKRLVIDYWELKKQIPKVQTTRSKSKSSPALIETAKIDHIWSKLTGTKYFSILDICTEYNHISIHPDSRPKTAYMSLWKI